jgi:hypothetical protein
MTLCPKCGKPLSVWYSLSREETGCACDNRACPLVDLEASGDSTQEVIERFIGESVVREARAARQKR